ncbi:hypothetical protein [Synechococcus sp. MU1648]|uniref:hypothetical protein n=1 Tax=Synechococcus sp. MU1648 TaxID=2508351 RepID=UPI00202733A3|nr:hypothetical protein [Synechococcus sp. MU1648]
MSEVLSGVGVGEGEGEGVGEGEGEGVGEGEGEGDGEGEGVGLVVESTVKVTVLLASFSSWLVLLAASENLSLAAWMTPLVVLSAVGVKVAV